MTEDNAYAFWLGSDDPQVDSEGDEINKLHWIADNGESGVIRRLSIDGETIIKDGEWVEDNVENYNSYNESFGIKYKNWTTYNESATIPPEYFDKQKDSLLGNLKNPKDLEGMRRVPLWLVPSIATMQAAVVHLLGAIKYGPFNWREKDISLSQYLSAIERHVNAVKEGRDIDSDDGMHHLAHVLATCNIVLDAKAHGTLVDDRKVGNKGYDLVREACDAASSNLVDKALGDKFIIRSGSTVSSAHGIVNAGSKENWQEYFIHALNELCFRETHGCVNSGRLDWLIAETNDAWDTFDGDPLSVNPVEYAQDWYHACCDSIG